MFSIRDRPWSGPESFLVDTEEREGCREEGGARKMHGLSNQEGEKRVKWSLLCCSVDQSSLFPNT